MTVYIWLEVIQDTVTAGRRLQVFTVSMRDYYYASAAFLCRELPFAVIVSVKGLFDGLCRGQDRCLNISRSLQHCHTRPSSALFNRSDIPYFVNPSRGSRTTTEKGQRKLGSSVNRRYDFLVHQDSPAAL